MLGLPSPFPPPRGGMVRAAASSLLLLGERAETANVLRRIKIFTKKCLMYFGKTDFHVPDRY